MHPSPAMHRHTRSDTGDVSSRSSRTPSFSSDRPSVASSVTFQMPSTVRPAAAYIAASVASQMVTDHVNAQLRHEDADSEELENAVFSEPALALLNAFLDHLLFALLSAARSSSLAAVRPAIADVLKPRLARDAIEAADEELRGLLTGEEDDEDMSTPHGRTADRWDVEKVWKRTRLRVMVYTRLGELEDEDEDRYVQQERGLSMDDDDDDDTGLVSWAAAIFLTSVVEYVAEQTLLVAAQAAFARTAAKLHKLAQHATGDDAPSFERLVIEEPDVEKIALNAALGRLWRTWRKRVRSPLAAPPSARGVGPLSSAHSLHRRQASDSTLSSLPHSRSFDSAHTPTETQIAANIPLPQRDNDVDEIEVPGLARTYDDTESSGTHTPTARPQRPMSVIMLASVDSFRRRLHPGRPLSMPIPETGPYSPLLPATAPEPETPFETPMTTMHDRDSYIGADELDGASQPRRVDESDSESDADMVAFAASTGMGLRMSTVGPIRTSRFENVEEEPETTSGGYESEPKIMHSQRMSVEKLGSPGLVRTFSARSSALKSPRETPVATPIASPHEGRSYLYDSQSDDEVDQPRDTGIARTSNAPVDHAADKGKHAANGGYVEAQPRQASSSSTSARNTPTPTRSLMRNRSSHESPDAASPPHDLVLTEPRSRGAPLPALQEGEQQTNKAHQRVGSENAQRRSAHFGNPKRNPSYRSLEAPISVAERQMQRSPVEHTARSRPSSHRSSSDISTTQQGASSSPTTKRPGSFTTMHNDIETASQRSLSRNLGERMSESDRERQFDSLVKGKETVKYTITPANMRDPESPVVQKVEPSLHATSPVTGFPRLSTDRDSSFSADRSPARTASRNKGPTAAHHRPSPSRKVVIRPLAREPRIEAESMRDFADFIRSTGPSPGQEKPVQPFVAISGNGTHSAGASSPSLTRNSSTKQSNRNADALSTRSRVNMEPRSPAGLSTGNNELIDFIRQGPPDDGHPRINRSIAPFRTTIDSDQFDGMLGNHGSVEAAYGSKASTLNSKHSTQTVNSRTGLLPAPNVVQPAYSNTPQMLTGNMASSSEPHVTRTRRRVKDPYAIDISDEEDDDDDEVEDQLTALPPSNQPKQESLMDFLSGMDPPSTSKPQPFMLSQEAIAAAKARANSSSNSSVSSSATAIPDATRGHQPSRVQTRAPAIVDTRARNTATSDLADFLRNSGPAELPASAKKDVPAEPEKKRRFWRSKKTTNSDT
ncbi:hypothetical protein P153DRAFT_314427 [Dothidotthia symphoricarpi CBS 119687]|uniref:Uncharacterized protein n=1 Tax=Dothidotthia symphoricarpi CBS 119687 TaxID=1392245 RepID=A0A6A6AGW5_9PLEO|nr:uncharacterized protein P153DRAFT_314427 [Dothidotthia symphoricarpi CBS 119687]KAF2130483.1 hypothetical protein P153DRAFT_314427 [Dothidotthia symphoricarpi CBS 119687]